jgi:non-heme chloroperoxidase
VTAATDIRVPGDGLSLAATTWGSTSDPAVVLLHGGGQTRHAWGTAGDVLAAGGRYAVSVDLRGHGDSEWAPDGDYGMTAFAHDTAAVVASLSSEPPMPDPVLVGASLGGLASLTTIGEGLARASALVLVDVTPRVEFDGAMRIRDFMAGGMDGFASLDDAADAIASFIPNRPRPSDVSGLQKNLRRRDDGRWYWHWDPAFVSGRGGIDGQGGLVDHDRLAAAAARVTVPTLLVRGRMSDIVSEEGVQELRRLVPHAEVVDVAGAGHMVAGDRNDAFNDAVLEFVDRVVPLGDR